MAKMLTEDQLIAELQQIAAEMVTAANDGNYDAREWLLQSYPGHTAFFRQQWRKPEIPRTVIRVHASRAAK